MLIYEFVIFTKIYHDSVFDGSVIANDSELCLLVFVSFMIFIAISVTVILHVVDTTANPYIVDALEDTKSLIEILSIINAIIIGVLTVIMIVEFTIIYSPYFLQNIGI